MQATTLPTGARPAYRPAATVEPFFGGGGGVGALPDGRLATVCGDEVKVG